MCVFKKRKLRFICLSTYILTQKKGNYCELQTQSSLDTSFNWFFIYKWVPKLFCIYTLVPKLFCSYSLVSKLFCIYTFVPKLICIYTFVPKLFCIYTFVPKVLCIYSLVPKLFCIYSRFNVILHLQFKNTILSPKLQDFRQLLKAKSSR